MRRCFILLLVISTPLFSTSYKRQISRGLAFLEHARTRFKPTTILALDLIARNHGVKFDLSREKRAILDQPAPNLQLILRVLDDRVRVSELEIRVLKGQRGILPTALYCDLYPIPWDYISKVQTMAVERGGYLVAWGLFAFSILKWQNCKFDQKKYADALQVLLSKARVLLYSEKVGSDLWLEIAQAFCRFGKQADITPTMVNELLRQQLPNGSWSDDPELTVKAIWLLILHAESRNRDHEFVLIKK
jgi:hypothetical protein